MSKKVYCKDCKYFCELSSFICDPMSWCEKVIDTYIIPAFNSPYTHYPEEIAEIHVKDYRLQNKNNNCNYYKRKWYKFWIK